jgi:hypothetical protein
MPSYKTNKIFKDDELRNMDIIHNPNVKLFEDQYDESYVIDEFINDNEKDILIDFYEKYKNVEVVNNHIYHIIFPLKEKVISDILRNKIYEHFGDDIYFYSDISNDPISVGDQFFKAVKPYGLHTDSVTHIDGYRPYKDIIIPIAIDYTNSSEYVTFNQRYRGHATQFMRGRLINSFANYHNVIRIQSYDKYGVENLDYSNKDHKQLEKIMPTHIPLGSYDGLSIEKILKWEPKTAIVQDTSVLHAPAGFNELGCRWKLGLTFHLMKKDDSYKNSIEGYYTPWSRYTQPMIKIND